MNSFGGAIYLENINFYLENIIFLKNTASNGGSIAVQNPLGNSIIKNTSFIGN